MDPRLNTMVSWSGHPKVRLKADLLVAVIAQQFDQIAQVAHRHALTSLMTDGWDRRSLVIRWGRAAGDDDKFLVVERQPVGAG
jgi:hypothetical protein